MFRALQFRFILLDKLLTDEDPQEGRRKARTHRHTFRSAHRSHEKLVSTRQTQVSVRQTLQDARVRYSTALSRRRYAPQDHPPSF